MNITTLKMYPASKISTMQLSLKAQAIYLMSHITYRQHTNTWFI